MSPRLAIVVALVLAVPAPRGQQPAPFRAGIGLVVLHAIVRNSHGEVMTTLTGNAFSVFENGKPQRIALFRHEDVPISLGLLLDNSGSMRSVRSRVETAALALIRASNPLDEVFVINFADKARLDVPMTRDTSVLESGIARVDSIGGTALRDAVDTAERYLREHATTDRKALIILSDGDHNASVIPMSRTQQVAEQNEIAVYAVGLSNNLASSRAKEGRRALEQLTNPTGGAAYFPAQTDDIDTLVADLARQIRSQYTIAYAPLNQTLDGSYRTIRIRARGPAPLTVITRAGYWATPQ